MRSFAAVLSICALLSMEIVSNFGNQGTSWVQSNITHLWHFWGCWKDCFGLETMHCAQMDKGCQILWRKMCSHTTSLLQKALQAFVVRTCQATASLTCVKCLCIIDYTIQIYQSSKNGTNGSNQPDVFQLASRIVAVLRTCTETCRAEYENSLNTTLASVSSLHCQNS